jgi:hypothetical protein
MATSSKTKSSTKHQLVAACMTLFALGAPTGTEASSSGRYLYNLDPYEVDPKSWATWRNSMNPKDWQEWCHDLNVQRWNWWRASMSPKNWQRWKETMGPADKALWLESSKMLPGILAREEQEEPAKHFKQKVLELKLTGKVVPKTQPSSAAASSQATVDGKSGSLPSK